MHGIRTTARLAGAFTLLTILTGLFAQAYVSDRLIDFGDAAATAANFHAHAGLLRLGFAVYSVLIDVGQCSTDTLASFSDRVASVSALTDDAVRDLFLRL